jgi:hypothetical protein
MYSEKLSEELSFVQLELYLDKTTPQALADGVDSDIVFTDADVIDHGSWHDPAGLAPEEWKVPAGKDGVYYTQVVITLGAITADAFVEIKVQGASDYFDTKFFPTGSVGKFQFSYIGTLAAAEVKKLQVKQTGIVAGLNLNASVMVIKIADALKM